MQLKKNDKNSIDGRAVGVVNHILHSIFRSSSVYLNNILIWQSDNNYHYRAYLQTIKNYGSAPLKVTWPPKVIFQILEE